MRIGNPKNIILQLIIISALCFMGCSRQSIDDKSTNSDVLLSFEDEELTLTDVLRRMPDGIDDRDSIQLFNAIIDEWLAEKLLEDAATANLGDDERINNMVENYHKRILVAEYRRRYSSNNIDNLIEEDSLKAYYNRHVDLYKLDRPVLKGIYIKLPIKSEWIPSVRKWIANPTPNNIDKLEKNALGDAVQYDYFIDTWQDWDAISNQIPYHFPDADNFVKNNINFETTYRDYLYILYISEFLNSGETMPYSIAAAQIKNALADAARDNTEKKLIKSLKIKAKKNGKLKYINLKQSPTTITNETK